MSRKLTIAALAAVAFAGPAVATGQVPPLPIPPVGAPPVEAPPVEVTGTAILGVGDTMEVEAAGIGCQVTQRGGKPAIECRKAGNLAGTYTVVFDAKRARVARFRNATTAKIVYTAKHGGRARACKASAGACR
jgi:hypothetical protein